MAKVLIVDDEPEIRALVARVVRSLGHESLEAENGVKAMAILRRVRFDLVVTDIIMPEKEGIETIKDIRRACAEAPPKILAISGGGRTHKLDFLKFAKSFGADETMAKPFRREQLVETIQRLLG